MTSLILGIVAGTLCTISFLPQVVRILRTKQTKDLSLVTFSIFALGVLCWLIYGIVIQEMPIILANTATLILVILIIVMKIKYR